MTDAAHISWTVNPTSYLRNLDQDDLRGECIAIHYQKPPVRNDETGSTTIGLCFPTLIVSLYMAEPQKVADRVAAILNKYWDSFDD